MKFLSDRGRVNRSKKIGTKELNNLIKMNSNLLIIDVRNKDEYNSGHIQNSMNIPLDYLSSNINYISNYKNSPVVVYCKAGIRSEDAANYLIQEGFTQIYVLRGGIDNYSGKLVY